MYIPDIVDCADYMVVDSFDVLLGLVKTCWLVWWPPSTSTISRARNFDNIWRTLPNSASTTQQIFLASSSSTTFITSGPSARSSLASWASNTNSGKSDWKLNQAL